MLLNACVDARGEVAVHSAYVLTPRRRGVVGGMSGRITLRSVTTGSWSALRSHCQMMAALSTKTS